MSRSVFRAALNAAVAAGALWVALAAFPSTAGAQTPPRWRATWSASLVARPQTPPPAPPPAPAPFMPSACAPPAVAAPPVASQPGQTFALPPFMHFTNQTLRQIVHTTLGGKRARVVLSNERGSSPLTIGAAHIAVRAKDDAIQAAESHPLTFSGRPTMTIPAFAVAYSDAVTLDVPPLSDLAIDVYLPGTTNSSAPVTMHVAAAQNSYVSETGNHSGAAKFPTVATTPSWHFLARVDVDAPDATGVVVAFGDSITDGTASTRGGNARWPDVLARRLLGASPAIAMGVVNAGIGGNRVLSEGTYGQGLNALARFDNDVLGQPGATHVIVLEGINDIGNARQNATPTAADLIAAHQQLIERAHAHGLKAIGATLTPFWGAPYYTEAGEAKRQALNDWIRNSKAYDGVIDFDKAARDPADPLKFLAANDSCDHLHPGDAGYKVMGEAIDLGLFRTTGGRSSERR